MLETAFNTRAMEYIHSIAEPTPRLHLLVVDADAAVRSACAEIAATLGYAVENTGDLEQARTLLRGRAADILLVNLPPGSNLGLELVAFRTEGDASLGVGLDLFGRRLGLAHQAKLEVGLDLLASADVLGPLLEGDLAGGLEPFEKGGLCLGSSHWAVLSRVRAAFNGALGGCCGSQVVLTHPRAGGASP